MRNFVFLLLTLYLCVACIHYPVYYQDPAAAQHQISIDHFDSDGFELCKFEFFGSVDFWDSSICIEVSESSDLKASLVKGDFDSFDQDIEWILDRKYFGSDSNPAILVFTPGFDRWCGVGHMMLAPHCSSIDDYIVGHEDYFSDCVNQRSDFENSFLLRYGRKPFIAFIPKLGFWECYDGGRVEFRLIGEKPYRINFD